MLSYTEAAQKAMTTDGLPLIRTAWDFGSFYVFSTAPSGIPKDQTYTTGTIFTAVEKYTGRVFQYDITSDLDAYDNAIIVVS